MGLAIVKAIVQAHDGSVGVTSQPGHGSVFSFSLPVWEKNR
jgi:signal transduction histidine kinase